MKILIAEPKTQEIDMKEGPWDIISFHNTKKTPGELVKQFKLGNMKYIYSENTRSGNLITFFNPKKYKCYGCIPYPRYQDKSTESFIAQINFFATEDGRIRFIVINFQTGGNQLSDKEIQQKLSSTLERSDSRTPNYYYLPDSSQILDIEKIFAQMNKSKDSDLKSRSIQCENILSILSYFGDAELICIGTPAIQSHESFYPFLYVNANFEKKQCGTYENCVPVRKETTILISDGLQYKGEPGLNKAEIEKMTRVCSGKHKKPINFTTYVPSDPPRLIKSMFWGGGANYIDNIDEEEYYKRKYLIYKRKYLELKNN